VRRGAELRPVLALHEVKDQRHWRRRAASTNLRFGSASIGSPLSLTVKDKISISK
jgi:hypothetical protein